MADPTLQDLMSLTVGTDVYLCTKYSASSKPILGSGGVPVPMGKELTIAGEIEVSGATGQLLADALEAACKSLSKTSTDLIIRSLGVVLSQILAAWCVNSGPQVEYKILEQTLASSRTLSFTATGITRITDGGGFGGGTLPPEVVDDSTSQLTTATGVNGLRTITRAGELMTMPGTTSGLWWVVDAFKSSYHWPHWAVSQDISALPAGAGYKYSLVAREMATPLPNFDWVSAVDGSASCTTEIDPTTSRKTRTVQVDLVCNGDPTGLADSLRPEVAPYTEYLSRITVEIATLPDHRLRATWVIISASEGDSLLDWQHTWEQPDEAWLQQTVREISMPGGSPVLVYGPKPAYHYVQRGRAVGLGAYIKAPYPLFSDYLEAPPKVTLSQLNGMERETTWAYQFVSLAPLVIQESDLDRPDPVETW